MKQGWIYLSHMLGSTTPGYGGRKDFEATHNRCMSKGDTCNQLNIKMSNHVGTHIDLPYHFDATGKKLEDYECSFWFFHQVEVLHLSVQADELILPSMVSVKNPDVDFLILKTGFERFRSEDVFWNANPGLSAELGTFLRSHFKNLRAIGFDCISATSFKNKEQGRLAHQAFLGSGEGSPILIVEDMKLAGLTHGTKLAQVHIAPLLVEAADGVPVTISAQIGF